MFIIDAEKISAKGVLYCERGERHSSMRGAKLFAVRPIAVRTANSDDCTNSSAVSEASSYPENMSLLGYNEMLLLLIATHPQGK